VKPAEFLEALVDPVAALTVAWIGVQRRPFGVLGGAARLVPATEIYGGLSRGPSSDKIALAVWAESDPDSSRDARAE